MMIIAGICLFVLAVVIVMRDGERAINRPQEHQEAESFWRNALVIVLILVFVMFASIVFTGGAISNCGDNPMCDAYEFAGFETID